MDNGWLRISDTPAPTEGLFMVYAPPDERFPEGRQVIVAGKIFITMTAANTPHHLQFPATHWRPMLMPPSGD